MGDLVALSEAASGLSREFAYLRDAEEALHWAEQAAGASQQVGTLRQQLVSALALGWSKILLGDSEGALASLETVRQVAERAGVEVSVVGGGGFTTVGARVHVSLGDWDEAETELLQLEEFYKQAHSQTSRLLWVFPTLGWLYLEAGNLLGAKTHLKEARAFSEAGGDNPPELVACCLLVQVCSKSGELEEAESYLRRAQEIFALSPDWLGLAAEVHLAEGVLAAAQGRYDEAAAAFQKAVEIDRQYHLPYYEARSLLEWAEMYLSRGESDDREHGMQLMDQALDVFQGIQAKKMVERVLGHKEVLSI